MMRPEIAVARMPRGHRSAKRQPRISSATRCFSSWKSVAYPRPCRSMPITSLRALCGCSSDRERTRLGAILDRAHLPTQTQCGVDQTDVTIGLREITQHATGERINLLAQQPHIITARQQPVEQLLRFRVTPLQNVIINEPETAREKRSFARRQAIARMLGFVAHDEFAIDQQPVLDRSKRSLDARVLRGKKTNDRDQQQAGIKSFRAVGLDKAAELAVEPALAHFGMDFVGDVVPPRRWFAELCSILGRAIEGNPGHHLGVDEVLRSAAYLPNAFVGLSPCRRQMVQDHRPHLTVAGGRLHASLEPLEHGVGDLAEYVELELLIRSISDPHRR